MTFACLGDVDVDSPLCSKTTGQFRWPIDVVGTWAKEGLVASIGCSAVHHEVAERSRWSAKSAYGPCLALKQAVSAAESGGLLW